MSDGFRPVSRGERIRISAATQNEILKTAEASRMARGRTGGGPVSFAGRETPPKVLIKNDSGSDIAQFGVLAVTGTLVEPADSDATWRERLGLIGDTPSASAPFVIAQEPIADGSIGVATILGVTAAILNVVDEDDEYAGPSTSLTELTTGASGPARILWKETGTGAGKKAVVLLLGAGGTQRVRVLTCVAFRPTGSSGSSGG